LIPGLHSCIVHNMEYTPIPAATMQVRSGLEMKKQNNKIEKVPGTAAFTKFMSVLQIVGDSPGTYGMAELCKRAKLPRATVYRIVDALRIEGLVTDLQPGNKFVLGPRLI